jgi:capsular exopolysaccharide synthesis family protein
LTQPGSQKNGSDEEVLSIDFHRYLGAVRKYAWVIVALMTVSITASVIWTNRQTKIYEATASIQIEPRLPDLLGQGQQAMGGAGGGATAEYYSQQREVLRSFHLIRRTVETLDLHGRILSERQRAGLTAPQQMDLAAERVAEDLRIDYPQQNRTMYVSIRNSNPGLAAEIANTHVAVFEAYAKGLLSTDTKQQSEALARELDEAEKNLAAAEAELYRLRKEHDLLAIPLEDRQSQKLNNIADYTRKLNEARTTRIELGARLESMKKWSAADPLESPVLGNAASLDSLRSQYYVERNKFIEIDKEVGPKTAEWIKQKAKLDDLHAALSTELRRAVGTVEEEYQAAHSTEKMLASDVERFKKEIDTQLIANYNEVLRKKTKFQNDYDILVAQLSNRQMAGRMNQEIDTNVKPLDQARVPTEPVYPRLKVNIVLAAILSMFGGVGLAFVLAFLDRSIKTLEDAQAAVNGPVLGIIPILAESELPRDDDKARDLYVHEHPSSRVAECCRSLRTNIVFSGADRSLKTLVVSSANPREGKTTTVMYLGTTMAQSGQKVLLIDTDMRRPRLHASTGVSRQKGLSNLIVGEDSYDDVIKSTEIPNLYVLPCGPLPPNPAELLMTKRFVAVLAELGTRFDRIILDSPPLNAVTDAVVLSTHTDGVILVVRAAKTLRDEIRRSAEQIRDVNGSIVGVIVNEFALTDRHGYYYQYYGYGERAAEAQTTA